MQLRFHARGTGLVSLPGENRIVGQLPRYIGRSLKMIDGATAWPANADAHECDSASDHGARLMKRCRRGELWAADEATATACGVEFVALEHSDGAWIPAASKPKRASYQTTKD